MKSWHKFMIVYVLFVAAIIISLDIFGVYSNKILTNVSSIILIVGGVFLFVAYWPNDKLYIPTNTSNGKESMSDKWYNDKDILLSENYSKAYAFSRDVVASKRRPQWTSEELDNIGKWQIEAKEKYISNKRSHTGTYVYVKYLQTYGEKRSYKSVYHVIS